MPGSDKSNRNSDNSDEIFHDVEVINDENKFAFYEREGNIFNDDTIITDQQLIKACMAEDLELIEEYLASGHDVNQFLLTGWTLLLYAASYGQPNLVKYLLNAGADPNIHQEGYTPLMALCFSLKGTPSNRLTCLKYLVEGNADVNATNKVKETALMYACKMQETDFILELLKDVGCINFADSEQRTALFYAVISNRYDVIKLLIDHGADISWMNFRGLTAYDIALSKGYDNLLPLLTIENNEECQDVLKTKNVTAWLDMFPVKDTDPDSIDSDVAGMLYGMGLESYSNCFRGLTLKEFLNLRETDLIRIGIDISVHRKKFLDEIFRFHKHEWNNLMKIDSSQEFSPFEALRILGNLNKQLTVMSSSVYFSKTCLDSIDEDESNFTPEEKEKLKIEMENAQIVALRIKEATERIRCLASIINEENSDLTLPIFIEKKKKSNHKWIVITVITLLGIYFFRLKCIKRLWNDEKSSSRSWRQIFNFSFANMFSFFLQKD